MSIAAAFRPAATGGICRRGRYEVLQIQDDAGTALDPQCFGGVWFARAVDRRGAAAREWQVCEITLVGRRISVSLNGTTVIDREIPGITGGALASDEGSPGPIMLQSDPSRSLLRHPADAGSENAPQAASAGARRTSAVPAPSTMALSSRMPWPTRNPRRASSGEGRGPDRSVNPT